MISRTLLRLDFDRRLKLAIHGSRVTTDARLDARIVEKIKAAIRVTPTIERVTKDEIYDPEKSMKSKRLIDERG